MYAPISELPSDITTMVEPIFLDQSSSYNHHIRPSVSQDLTFGLAIKYTDLNLVPDTVRIRIHILFCIQVRPIVKLNQTMQDIHSFNSMVLKIDDNDQIDAQVGSNPCYLICLRHQKLDREQSKICVHISLYLFCAKNTKKLIQYLSIILRYVVSMLATKVNKVKRMPSGLGNFLVSSVINLP